MSNQERQPASPWASEGDEAAPWTSWNGDDPTWLPKEIDTTVAHPARRYDYWLGGKDHFAADRESGDAIAAVFPTVRIGAVENRRFLGRAVRYLAEEAGIDQFLDIGTGIPTAGNTHEVAQAVNPAARVVYVDNDPIVLAHARALLTTTHADGATAYIDADLRDPDTILRDPALVNTLDLTRPVALMLIAVLPFLRDEDHPHDVVRTLVDALPPGSYLAMTHATVDFLPPEEAAKAEATGRSQGIRVRNRSELARFFDGHDLIDPGIVSVTDWHAESEVGPRPSAAEVSVYGAVARLHPKG